MTSQQIALCSKGLTIGEWFETLKNHPNAPHLHDEDPQMDIEKSKQVICDWLEFQFGCEHWEKALLQIKQVSKETNLLVVSKFSIINRLNF